LHAAVDGIRQLVYDLRPPALDELGLVGAVREHVATLASRSVEATAELELHVDSVDVAAALPAAVEVAAYRIALEAITNVTRHALAHHCWVRINTSTDALHVEIEDDGQGMDTDRHAGVGLRSMRDRATELGGELSVRPGTPHGTLIRASLPLALAAGGLAS
ncbi:MAG: histidine kinase, partial [Acidimicrobiaceae bacterium]